MTAPDLPPAAARKLAEYVPQLASPEHAPLIREAAVWAVPRTKHEAAVVAAALSGMVWWAEQTGQPVRLDALLTPHMVEAYMAQAPLAQGTKTSQTGILMRIVRRRPGPHARPRPGSTPPDTVRAPYTPNEVQALLSWASGQPSDLRQHALLAILVTGLGAGLSPTDLRLVLGTDIAQDPDTGHVTVHVRADRPRRVPFLAAYEQDALRLAATAGDRWIVNPQMNPEKVLAADRNAIARQVAPAQPAADAPRLVLDRCRITWICHHLAAGTRLDVLIPAAGLTNGSTLLGYARHLTPPPPDEVMRQLREA